MCLFGVCVYSVYFVCVCVCVLSFTKFFKYIFHVFFFSFFLNLLF